MKQWIVTVRSQDGLTWKLKIVAPNVLSCWRIAIGHLWFQHSVLAVELKECREDGTPNLGKGATMVEDLQVAG